jgi:hypothetical protein
MIKMQCHKNSTTLERVYQEEKLIFVGEKWLFPHSKHHI